jgi:hypothetical protein
MPGQKLSGCNIQAAAPEITIPVATNSCEKFKISAIIIGLA